MNPPDPEPEPASSPPVPPFILRIPGERFRAAKGIFVQASRIHGQKLTAWMLDALERQARAEIAGRDAGRNKRPDENS